MRRITVYAVAAAAVSALQQQPHDAMSREEVLSILQRENVGVPADFECGWRQLAYKYAQQLQPFRSAAEFQEIFTALQLQTCGADFTLPKLQLTADTRAGEAGAAATSIYVDFSNGNDSNSGSITQPLQHVSAAVTLSRTLPRPLTIFLRGGVHRLTATLELGPQDNGLTITGYNGENAVVSSGVVLPVTSWSPYNVSANRVMNIFNNSNNVYGQAGTNPSIVEMGVFNTSEECHQACMARPNCTSFTWHGPIYPGWANTCWERSDWVWSPTAENDIVSGYWSQPMNVWVTDLGAPGSAGNPLPSWLNTPARPDFVMSLQYSVDGGVTTQRATRARWPNANPETDRFPTGWTGAGTYTSHTPDQDTQVVHVANPNPGDPPGMFATDYWWGYGGPCERFMDNGSYWCQPNGRVAGATYFVNTPSALTVTNAALPTASQYAANPQAAIDGGAIVNYWRHGHWFTLMSRLASINAVNGTEAAALNFGLGLFQGCEGDATGEDWYIENSPFELDFPNEFYYDPTSGKLYYYYNYSGTLPAGGVPPPSDWTFEVPMLQVLINITGTSDNPATGITISGITFTGAAPTYLAPHGLPSGGDWGLARVGSVFLEGTQDVMVQDCSFWRVDGNGVFVNGWNRNATVDRCSFKWIGESAVATWGYTNGVDATDLNVPLYTTVTNNMCRLIGSTEKQVSCFGQFVSARSNVSNNIMFNMPRAAVNFNDYVGGGSIMSNNLIWDTCMESQDHGPFNSWDRVPYIVPEGFRQPYEMHHNFMVAGGGANGGAFDNDDGSSFYDIHHNVEVYGGHKSDFDGHAKVHHDNLNLFSYVYGDKCVGIMNLPTIPGFAEGYYNNTCVLVSGGTYMDIGSCQTGNATEFAQQMIVGGNQVFVDGTGGAVSCGGDFNFSAWQATGLDRGTNLTTTLPTTATMMQWAAALLNIQQ